MPFSHSNFGCTRASSVVWRGMDLNEFCFIVERLKYFCSFSCAICLIIFGATYSYFTNHNTLELDGACGACNHVFRKLPTSNCQNFLCTHCYDKFWASIHPNGCGTRGGVGPRSEISKAHIYRTPYRSYPIGCILKTLSSALF